MPPDNALTGLIALTLGFLVLGFIVLSVCVWRLTRSMVQLNTDSSVQDTLRHLISTLPAAQSQPNTKLLRSVFGPMREVLLGLEAPLELVQDASSSSSSSKQPVIQLQEAGEKSRTSLASRSGCTTSSSSSSSMSSVTAAQWTFVAHAGGTTQVCSELKCVLCCMHLVCARCMESTLHAQSSGCTKQREHAIFLPCVIDSLKCLINTSSVAWLPCQLCVLVSTSASVG